MDGNRSNEVDVANRILLAMVVVFGAAPVTLGLLEHLLDGEVLPLSQIAIGITALLVIAADRIYLGLKSRQKDR